MTLLEHTPCAQACAPSPGFAAQASTSALDTQASWACREARLAEANRQLEAYVGQAAHELRTPIGQLKGLAQLVLLQAPVTQDDASRRLVELQLRIAEHMSATLDSLLELARIDRAPLLRVEIDLSALCSALVQALPAQARRATVDWRIAPGLRINGCPVLVTVLMRNLLSNAAKYSRDVAQPVVSVGAVAAGVPGAANSGAHAGARVDARGNADAGTGTGTTFFVQDNGAGFDPTAAAQLFQPFARLHAQARFEGCGIGLALAKRIVERHGGWIHAEGAVDRGARFEFQLPPAAADQLGARASTRG